MSQLALLGGARRRGAKGRGETADEENESDRHRDASL